MIALSKIKRGCSQGTKIKRKTFFFKNYRDLYTVKTVLKDNITNLKRIDWQTLIEIIKN